MDEAYFKSIDSINVIDKVRIYMRYYIMMIAMKHDFIMVNKNQTFYPKGYGDPDLMVNNIHFFYLWKRNFPVLSFDAFVDQSNYKITDNGENWKERGFAKQKTVSCSGIYEYVWHNPSVLKEISTL